MEFDIEKYKKLPNKCKLSFKLLARLLNTPDGNELIYAHRKHRLKCWNTNKKCPWEICIYDMTRKQLYSLKCPECGGKLKLTRDMISCIMCGFAFEIVKFE